MKGALLPGDPGKAKGFEKFKAKIISMTPENKPKELVLALAKPDVADVTLKFEEALPGNMEPGSEIEFEGVPDSYTKDPFMVTFLVTKEQLGDSWTGTNPVPARERAKARAHQGRREGKGEVASPSEDYTGRSEDRPATSGRRSHLITPRSSSLRPSSHFRISSLLPTSATAAAVFEVLSTVSST